MNNFKIIDSHQHVFWHKRDDVGLIADMDENKIDKAWLLTWEVPARYGQISEAGLLNPVNVRWDGTHAGITLSDLLIAKRRYPQRFILGYCPEPQNPQAGALFESAYHIHGVRVCGEWKFRVLFDDPSCIELYKVAGRLKCPVVLHLDVPYRPADEGGWRFAPRWYGGTVDNLERALQACPETNFIGHAPGFWREISGDAAIEKSTYPTGQVTPGGKVIRLLSEYPNLYADLSANSALSALKRDPAHAAQFLTKFADKLLFGRDIYGADLLNYLGTLDLGESVKAKILGDNARKLVPEG